MKKTFLLFLLMALPCLLMAQSRSVKLTVHVSSVEGDDLTNQPITLMQMDYQVSYGSLRLDAAGTCQVNVYPGNHRLTVEREGFETLVHDFAVADGASQADVDVTLAEKTRTPYALTASLTHNSFTGKDDVLLSWNKEAPAFFDDFESYDPFAVQFGEWTGIDADMEVAAALLGNYPNRGVMQYAQIINPLTVEPTWWYDYPILRPYSGQQYVGFTRTNSGNANDDWLISPVITVGTDNILSFMGKAADQYTERFMVYATTKLDSPVQSDFVRLDKDNYEAADYKGWKEYVYDLSAYAGQQIRFAIRYVSDFNRYRSFMLMVDDVYVGQDLNDLNELKAPKVLKAPKALRAHSPANPNELFHIYLDGTEVGTTDGYSYTIEGVTAGSHTIGVQASYIHGLSEMATTLIVVPEPHYSVVTFNVTANSILPADGQQLSLLSMATTETFDLTVADGKAVIPSLPNGQYVVNIAEGAFEACQQTIDVTADMTVDIVLEDRVLDPYNITLDLDDDDNLVVRWNQELVFCDSFEDYDDFATGAFGEWKTVDDDMCPVYPIALGAVSNIISFPGSGTAANPMPVAPMVFNPWKTTPPMMPTDPAIAAPTGDKTVIFFSPQGGTADKWLISPLFDIREGYTLRVTAKGYSAIYPEKMEFCVSDGSDNPADFVAISHVNPLSSEEWTIYETDLADYVDKKIRLAIHYTSYDAFLAQVDDFTVGPPDGQGEMVDYGNVVRYDIYLDGVKLAETTKPEFVMADVDNERHVLGIQAIYKNRQSQLVEYILGDTEGIRPLSSPHPSLLSPLPSKSGAYDLQGRPLSSSPAPIIILNGKKQIVK